MTLILHDLVMLAHRLLRKKGTKKQQDGDVYNVYCVGGWVVGFIMCMCMLTL